MYIIQVSFTTPVSTIMASHVNRSPEKKPGFHYKLITNSMIVVESNLHWGNYIYPSLSLKVVARIK